MNDKNNWSQDEKDLASLLTNGLNKMSEGTCPSIEKIAQLVEGSLTDSEKDALLKHVAGCNTCLHTLQVSRELHRIPATKKPIFYRPWALAASILIVGFSAILFFQIGINKSHISEPASSLKEEKVSIRPKEARRTYSKSGKGVPEDESRMKSVPKKGEKTWDVYPRGTAKNVYMQKRARDTKRKDHEADIVESKKRETEGQVLEKLGDIEEVEKETLKKGGKKNLKASLRAEQEADKEHRQVAGKRLPGVAKAPVRKVREKKDSDYKIDGMNVQQEAAPATLSRGKQARCYHRDRFSQSTEYLSGISRQRLPLLKNPLDLISSQNLPPPVVTEEVVSIDILLEMEIDSKGNVMGVCIKKGFSHLTQDLIRILFAWKFRPLVREGKPVAARFLAALTFDLSESLWRFNDSVL